MSYIVYIDESGDEGFSVGSSKWFGMSCIIIQGKNDLSLVNHRKNIIQNISRHKKNPLKTIHFSELDHDQRKFVCNYMVTQKLPIRSINILVNKSDIPDNTVKNYKEDKNRFYWYTARLLLERISWFIRDHNKSNDINQFPQIIFSNRRQSKVEYFVEYLNLLKNKKNEICWEVFKIDCNHIKSIPHNQRAGLQFADCFATSFRKYVFERNRLGESETTYSRILKPFIYHKNGNYESYGFKILGSQGEQCKEVKELLKLYNIKKG